MKKIILFCVTLIFSNSTISFAQIKVGTIKQVSIGANSTVPSGASSSPVIASNGQLLAFDSSASNLVSSDTNNAGDVFITQIANGATSRVSISSTGIEGNDDSSNPTISPIAPDGFYVIAFDSLATNLSSLLDQSRRSDIFVRIPSLNVTEVISLGAGSVFGNGNSRFPSITMLPAPNRILITFASDASNLVTPDLNKTTDIFLASLTIPTPFNVADFLASLKIVRVSNGAQQSDGPSANPKISGDGANIVFTSSATNLIPGITTSGRQIYQYNLKSGQISLVSKDLAGVAGNGDSYAASISYSGRFISYITEASSLISGASASNAAVVVFDQQNGSTTRVNSNAFGVAGDGTATEASLSASGRFLTFSDSSTNLVVGDSNGIADAFVKDLSTGQISRVSIGESGNQGNGASNLPSVAGGGYNSLKGILAFRSFATNFSSAGLSSGSDIFANSATLSPRAFVRSTLLEVPPDIKVKKRNATLGFEKFSTVSAAVLEISTFARASSTSLQYDVRINKAGGKARDNIRKLSKKNQIALKNLKPGNYTAKYRVTTLKGKKVVKSTKFSPVQKFSVLKK